ncbi:uncharacterized protein LOC133205784 [Saccostrea echinata]|uniref:uncharacterized protein LOC133205784 n=1 Tax=Saccostrea echinata TaxID=191078 RepID=UPI002A82B955|nr:uncharacterized protein LOC133205784 [Saccostrea echinata]
MGAEWVLLMFILEYHGEGLGQVINRGQIRCFVQNCSKNQVFLPCTKDNTSDLCIDCPVGYFMPDRIDTSKWTEPPDCYKNDCDQCDTIESVLDNPKECGDTEKAHCVCDRTKNYYGENSPGPVTSCTLKIGDLCHRKGTQLNQKGECEPCPPGTEKNRADSSLCTKIETKEITTPKQGTETLNKHSTAILQTTSTYTSSTIPNGKLPTSDSDVGTVIGVIVGVVVFLSVIIILIVLCSRKCRKINDNDKTDSEICCPLERPRDSTSEDSSTGSETGLLLNKDKTRKHEETNGYPVKPTIAVKPMLSVDETKKDEEEEFDNSLNVGGFVNDVNTENNNSTGRDRNIRPHTELDSLGHNATEVKVVHSRDETDLKVPVQTCSNGGQDLHRTRVKTTYSEETEVKQIGSSPSSRRIQDNSNSGVKPFVSSDETAEKQVVLGDSRRMLDSYSTRVKPFVSSEETSRKEIGRDHFSETLNNVCTDFKADVSPEVTCLKESEMQAKTPVSVVRSVQPVSPVIPPIQFQSREGSDLNEVNVTQVSPANQRQQAGVVHVSNQNNSVQPTVCPITDRSESLGSDTIVGIASDKNAHKNTTNKVTLSHQSQQPEINQEESSSFEKQSSQTRSEEINDVADSDRCTEKNKGHSHTETVCGGLISKGYLSNDEGESVELASTEINKCILGNATAISAKYQPNVMSRSSQESDVHHPNQYVPHQSHQSNLNQQVQSNQPQPDHCSQHQPDQPSQQQQAQSRFNNINNGLEMKSNSSSVPIPSGASPQNSGASYVQMSVQNSAATSGYGTARRSEMGTLSETANNIGHERSINNTSSAPLIVNSLLRSDSRNAGDHLEERKTSSNDSLGTSGLNNAPSLNPESSDEVKQIEEMKMPMVIKKEPDSRQQVLEGEIDSSMQRVLNQAFVAQGAPRAESGYCS